MQHSCHFLEPWLILPERVTAKVALFQPGCLLQKVLAVKDPGDLYTLAMSQVSYKERTNTTMVTKDWSTQICLSRFPKNAHETLLVMLCILTSE